MNTSITSHSWLLGSLILALMGCASSPDNTVSSVGIGGNVTPSASLASPLDFGSADGQWYIGSWGDGVEVARQGPLMWVVVGKEWRQEQVYLDDQRQRRVGAQAASALDSDIASRVDMVIRFASGKTGPMPQPRQYRKQLANLKAAPVILIRGHADAVGSHESNQRLSEARAQTVSAWLRSQGVTNAQIQIEAFGETRAVATNGTAQGRALNRRVEVAH